MSFNQGAKYTEVSNRGLNYLPYAHFSEEAGKLSNTLSISSGGTGATSSMDARANLGLGNVDNTADVDKPVSGLVLAELTSKESILNKSNSIISDSASSLKYPSVKAVKAYVDNRTANANVANQANSANLAAKATTLETPRTINGVPFDGSTNISIPIDAAILTGIIPITKGGTGAVTASSARTNLGLKIGVDVQAPLVAGVDYQRPLVAGINYQIPLVAGTDYQRPLISGTDYQAPLIAGRDYQVPLVAGVDFQMPLIASTDYQIPLIPGIDYQVPLVSGIDYQAPLVAGADYQAPLTAGSGIVLSGRSIAVSELTRANLSATAGITNGQLANSQLTLGSTITSLGGTYTNLSGFASVTSSNFVGDLTGNASTATTAVSASSAIAATTALTALNAITANSAITALTANTASMAISATFATSAAIATTAVTATSATTALTSTTATTLSTPRNIFGFPFDGSIALSGIISPTFGGTGVNNGNKSITLGGDLITSGNYSTTIITTGNTSISLPTSGTLATLAGTETLTNKTFVNSSLTGTLTLGGTTFPSSSGATGQVLSLTSSGVASWTSVLKDGFDETASNGSAGTMTTTTAGQTNFTLTQAPHSTSRLKMYINGILISQNAYAYKTSSSFASDATVPTPFLAYINAKNGTYLIAVGDRVQFVYSY